MGIAPGVKIPDPIHQIVGIIVADLPRGTAMTVVVQVVRKGALGAGPHNRANRFGIAFFRMQPASHKPEQALRGSLEVIGGGTGDDGLKLRFGLRE
jgi:hypothetical protein